MTQNLSNLKKELHKLGNPTKKKILQNFFKTGKGQYGEGDVFFGVSVPESRNIAKKYECLSLENIKKLLNSKIHEERLTALLILVYKYKNGSESAKNKIMKFYLMNAKKVNSWDLVDLSSYHIVGDFLKDSRDRKILYTFAKSKNLWE